MNSCEHYQELISRLVDADVSREEYDELLRHMNTCSRCSALYAVFYDLSEIIGAEEPVELPEGLHENIMAGVRRSELEKKNRRARSVWSRTALTAAACAALILFAVRGFSPTERAENAVVRSQQAAEELFPAEEEAVPETAAAAGEAMPAPSAEAKPTLAPEESPAPEGQPAPTQAPASVPQTSAAVMTTAAPQATTAQNVIPTPVTPAPETPTPATPIPETPAPATPIPETPAPATPIPETPVPVPSTPTAASTETDTGLTHVPETAAPAESVPASPAPAADESPEPAKAAPIPENAQEPAPTASIQVRSAPQPRTAITEPTTITDAPAPNSVETDSETSAGKTGDSPASGAEAAENAAPAAASADAVEEIEMPTPRRIKSLPRLTTPLMTPQEQESQPSPEVSESPTPSAEPKKGRRESFRITKDENRQKLQILLSGREALIPDGTPDKIIEVTLIPNDAYGSEEKLTIRLFETEVCYESTVNGETRSFAAACSPAELEALLKTVSEDEAAVSPSPSAAPSAAPTASAAPDPYLESPPPQDQELK